MTDLQLKQSFNTAGRKTYKYDTTLFTNDYGDTMEREFMVSTDLAESTLISSQVLGSDMHKPCIDVDLPVRVYPSSTLGHFHLYIDKEMTWWNYRRLLRALVKAGIVERGFYKASLSRKATHLRLPWIRK
jgi:hypothetical protein